METLSNISVSFRSTLVTIFPEWDNKDADNAAEKIAEKAREIFPGGDADIFLDLDDH